MSTDALSLYYHFPFCTRKCNYCAFYSLPQIGEPEKDAYLSALQEQTLSFPDKRALQSVYFGGGTPPLFGKERLCALLSFLREHKTFRPDCEITMEINPKTADRDFLLAMRDAGVNRLSIGMQSSDDAQLRALGRIHTFADVCRCVENARSAGFDNYSLDLLFALPDQSVESFAQSLRDAFALQPTHLSVYSLQLEEGTAFFRNRETLAFPTEEVEEAQYDLLCQATREQGFAHYEISSFAKNGCVSRHNLNYWQRGEYIGLGAAAHSFWSGKRFSNLPNLRAYLQNPLDANDYKQSERISETEAWEESVLLGLRTADGIPASSVGGERFGCMESLGLMCRLPNGNIRITERGWRVSNAVIGQLLI